VPFNSVVNSDPNIPPSSAWVRFLRSYGPTPNNSTLFDEYVTNALRRAKVRPITLSSPLLQSLRDRALSGEPGSLLIAGTAGDGKTYHCRSLWTALGGAAADWETSAPLKSLRLADGRNVVFVKDLSELSDDQSDDVLTLLEGSVLGGDDAQFVVLASNHGQILERLRELGVRKGREHPLRKPLQDAFLLYAKPPHRLHIFDLSRTTTRESMNEILATIAEHPEWENCSTCSLQADGRVCPIFENRRRLLSSSDEGRFAKRLGDLVEVARLSGWHLPVRDLLALTANMILGHPDTKEGLMACSDVAGLQQAGTRPCSSASNPRYLMLSTIMQIWQSCDSAVKLYRG
jgi:hypothetical protein